MPPGNGLVASGEGCHRCGSPLENLRHPVRRLLGTPYWRQGIGSYFTGQLRICTRCGAIYTSDGELLAAGAVETDAERRLKGYRKDMAHLRDAFAAVVIASELALIWLVTGGEGAELSRILLTAGVGVGALAPFTYFARKARLAKRDLKRMREARLRGAVPAPVSPISAPRPAKHSAERDSRSAL